MTHDAQATHGRKKPTAKQLEQLNEDFYLACNRGDYPNALELHAEGADINFRYGSDGTTPLHAAAGTDNVELATWLLENGADARAATNDGITPLHNAAFHSTTAMLEVLVRHKADINATTKLGMPVIHRAITGLRDNSAKLKWLIVHGARTDIPNYDGEPIAKKIKFHGKQNDMDEAVSLKQARTAQLTYLARRKQRQMRP